MSSLALNASGANKTKAPNAMHQKDLLIFCCCYFAFWFICSRMRLCVCVCVLRTMLDKMDYFRFSLISIE